MWSKNCARLQRARERPCKHRPTKDRSNDRKPANRTPLITLVVAFQKIICASSSCYCYLECVCATRIASSALKSSTQLHITIIIKNAYKRAHTELSFLCFPYLCFVIVVVVDREVFFRVCAVMPIENKRRSDSLRYTAEGTMKRRTHSRARTHNTPSAIIAGKTWYFWLLFELELLSAVYNWIFFLLSSVEALEPNVFVNANVRACLREYFEKKEIVIEKTFHYPTLAAYLCDRSQFGRPKWKEKNRLKILLCVCLCSGSMVISCETPKFMHE